jgi:hypothetical protein
LLLHLTDLYAYNVAFLGERPYNDDSLLSDSMKIVEEPGTDIENASTSDLNSTQIAQQVDDAIALTKDSEEQIHDEPNNTISASDVVCVVKVNTPVKTGSIIKKMVVSKKGKKKTSEVK